MKIRFFDPGLSYRKIKDEIVTETDRVRSAGDLILREDVEKFEETLAQYVGTRYAVGLNSGTDALFLALKALGIGPGDEVITVSHTFFATIEAIHHTGAIPVLIDINDDYLMDMDELEKAITPYTKAIIPVHLSGDVCDMDRVRELAGSWISVIEDSAQALGAEWDGVKAGSMGDIGCFSFYPAKVLGGDGDGGAITTDYEDVYEKIRDLRNHYNLGKDREGKRFVDFGYNSRLDNIHAAVLNVKFRYLKQYIEQRQSIADIYNERLKKLPIILPKQRNGRIYQDYVIRAKDRKELDTFLNNAGIETLGTGLTPNHKYKSLELDFSLPKTEKYAEEFIRLPCNPNITNEEADYVCETIERFYSGLWS